MTGSTECNSTQNQVGERNGDITTVETNAGGLDYFQLADEPRTGLRLLRWNGATQPDYENRRLRIRHRSSRITS